MTQKTGQRKMEFIDVTPAQAKQWLAGNVANRDKRDRYIKELARAMTQNEWIETPEPIVFADKWTDPKDGKVYDDVLTAGQHRLQAVVLSGKTIRFLVVFHSDAAELTVMSQGKPWTQGDILKSTRVGVKHPTVVASIISAFLYHGLGFTEGAQSWIVRRVLDRIEPEIMQAVAHKLRLKGLVHRQFMAALVLALLIDPEVVGPFVKQVKAEVSVPYGDPTKLLRQYLYDYIMKREARDLPEVYFYKCCNGIAAKLKGEPLKKLDADPAGLAYLRDKASAKLEPILKDIFGKTPHGFYSPKPPRDREPK